MLIVAPRCERHAAATKTHCIGGRVVVRETRRRARGGADGWLDEVSCDGLVARGVWARTKHRAPVVGRVNRMLAIRHKDAVREKKIGSQEHIHILGVEIAESQPRVLDLFM